MSFQRKSAWAQQSLVAAAPGTAAVAWTLVQVEPVGKQSVSVLHCFLWSSGSRGKPRLGSAESGGVVESCPPMCLERGLNEPPRRERIGRGVAPGVLSALHGL